MPLCSIAMLNRKRFQSFEAFSLQTLWIEKIISDMLKFMPFILHTKRGNDVICFRVYELRINLT
jgi:hypothetical protein